MPPRGLAWDIAVSAFFIKALPVSASCGYRQMPILAAMMIPFPGNGSLASHFRLNGAGGPDVGRKPVPSELASPLPACAGMMGNRIVIPVHNTALELVAYAGYHHEECTYTYPPKFRRDLELFNLGGALASHKMYNQGLILVRHPLEALMLISAGYPNTVALMGETIAKEQVGLLFNTDEVGEKLTLFWPIEDSTVVHTLSQLLHLFFIRLIRYKQKDSISSGFTADDAQALLG